MGISNGNGNRIGGINMSVNILVKNNLLQCMGCKGYDKSENMIWLHHHYWGNTFPFCTKECFEVVK